jgi:hypothetical protein
MIQYIKKILKQYSVLNKTIYPIAFKLSVLFQYRRIIIKKYGFEILRLVDAIAQEHKIPYNLDYGTLLGIIREGGFIKHDRDMDFTILPSDLSLASFTKELIKHGFVFESAYLIDGARFYEFRVRYKEVSIDFYLPIKYENYYKFIMSGFEVIHPQYTLERLPVQDFFVNIPSDVIEHLKWCYGDSWNIPDKNWHTNKSKSYLGIKPHIDETIEDLHYFLDTIDRLNGSV